jgi:hypothetical protein
MFVHQPNGALSGGALFARLKAKLYRTAQLFPASVVIQQPVSFFRRQVREQIKPRLRKSTISSVFFLNLNYDTS